MPPRKPNMEKIEVTISNYTKRDVVSARRDLNLLKQRIQQRQEKQVLESQSQTSR